MVEGGSTAMGSPEPRKVAAEVVSVEATVVWASILVSATDDLRIPAPLVRLALGANTSTVPEDSLILRASSANDGRLCPGPLEVGVEPQAGGGGGAVVVRTGEDGTGGIFVVVLVGEVVAGRAELDRLVRAKPDGPPITMLPPPVPIVMLPGRIPDDPVVPIVRAIPGPTPMGPMPLLIADPAVAPPPIGLGPHLPTGRRPLAGAGTGGKASRARAARCSVPAFTATC